MKKLFVVLFAIAFDCSFASAQNLWSQGKMSWGCWRRTRINRWASAGDHMSTGIVDSHRPIYGINEDVLVILFQLDIQHLVQKHGHQVILDYEL